MIKKILFLILISVSLITACEYRNEEELFPRAFIADSIQIGEIAYFPMDGSIENALETDVHVQVFGHPEACYSRHGDSASAMSFNGSKDYFTGFIGDQDTLAVSLWFLAFPNLGSQTLFDYGINNASSMIDDYTGATLPLCQIVNRLDSTYHFSVSLTDYFNWHHLYVDFVPPDMVSRIYIDAIPDYESCFDQALNPLVDLIFFARASSGENVEQSYFRGYLDDIHIFNQSLSEEEVVLLFEEGINYK